MNQVIVAMATTSSRIPLLERSIRSILFQNVDRLFVYLNGQKHIPPILQNNKIEVAFSHIFGDRADAGKFWWADKVHGYYLTIDDDFIYPPDYVDRMVESVEKYKKKAIVGVHGHIYVDPFISYSQSRIILKCTEELKKDQQVHGLGTATMAYHTETILVSPNSIGLNADPYLATIAQMNHIPMVAISRPPRWINSLKTPFKGSISSRWKQYDDKVTKLIKNHIPWKLWPLDAS